MKRPYSRPTVRTLTPEEAQAIFKKVREHRRLLNLAKGWAELYLWERGIDPKPRPPRWSRP